MEAQNHFCRVGERDDGGRYRTNEEQPDCLSDCVHKHSFPCFIVSYEYIINDSIKSCPEQQYLFKLSYRKR